MGVNNSKVFSKVRVSLKGDHTCLRNFVSEVSTTRVSKRGCIGVVSCGSSGGGASRALRRTKMRVRPLVCTKTTYENLDTGPSNVVCVRVGRPVIRFSDTPGRRRLRGRHEGGVTIRNVVLGRRGVVRNVSDHRRAKSKCVPSIGAKNLDHRRVRTHVRETRRGTGRATFEVIDNSVDVGPCVAGGCGPYACYRCCKMYKEGERGWAGFCIF